MHSFTYVSALPSGAGRWLPCAPKSVQDNFGRFRILQPWFPKGSQRVYIGAPKSVQDNFGRFRILQTQMAGAPFNRTCCKSGRCAFAAAQGHQSTLRLWTLRVCTLCSASYISICIYIYIICIYVYIYYMHICIWWPCQPDLEIGSTHMSKVLLSKARA